MRKLEELTADINGYNIHAFSGKVALGNHIRSSWTIDEIIFFFNFTHGGIFQPPGGEWRVRFFGYVAKSATDLRNIIELFKSLQAEAWAYIGAFVHGQGMRRPWEIFEKSADMGGMTLDGLARLIPQSAMEEIRAMLGTIEENTAIAAGKKAEASKRGRKYRCEQLRDTKAERADKKRDLRHWASEVGKRVEQGQTIRSASRNVANIKECNYKANTLQGAYNKYKKGLL